MKQIKICADIKHPPFEFINKKGEIDGFSVEIIKNIAKEMELDVKIDLLDWTEAIQGMEGGDYDIIQGMSISGERSKRYHFGREYLTVFHSMFALKKRNDIKDIININKYRIAVQQNDAGLDIISSFSSNKTHTSILVVSNQEDALKLLLTEKVDIVIGNKLTLLYYADQLGIEKDIKLLGNPINLTKYGLAFKKDDIELAAKFDMGMDIIKKNGIYEEVYEKWFTNTIGYFGKQIIENVETGVIYIDRLGRITAMNNFAQNILNMNTGNIIFKSFYETELAAIFNTYIIQQILDKRQDAYHARIEIDQDNVKKYLEVSYAKLQDDKNDLMGVLINFIDISDKKRLEDGLIRKDRMESLGFLLLNVAHEVRNPLTSMKNFIELIPKHIDDEEFRESLLHHVPKQIEYIDKIFTDLLEYSKPKLANIDIISVNKFVENEFIKSMCKVASKDKDINYIVDIPDDFTIIADYNQIKQVLINLILNAIDSIKDSGTVNIYSLEEDDKKIIVVEDDGEGVDAEEVSKIFDPFFTTKAKGTGLGLFISYNLMKENRGSIEIINTGKGTMVYMIFDE